MNIIFARHDGCQKDFCWQVPDNLKDYISKGDILHVETMRGLDIATAATGVISGDGARDIAESKGAYFPLKSVVSFVNKDLEKYILHKDLMYAVKKMNITMSRREDMLLDELPF